MTGKTVFTMMPDELSYVIGLHSKMSDFITGSEVTRKIKNQTYTIDNHGKAVVKR